MSDKIPISVEQAVDLLRLAIRNGTEQAGVDLAHEWMKQAQVEILRLRARVAELEAEIGGFPHLRDLRQAMIETANENESLRRDVSQLHAYLDAFVERERHDARAFYGDNHFWKQVWQRETPEVYNLCELATEVLVRTASIDKAED